MATIRDQYESEIKQINNLTRGILYRTRQHKEITKRRGLSKDALKDIRNVREMIGRMESYLELCCEGDQ